MDYNAMSLVVEIQFLLKFMLRTKKKSHQYYEITRAAAFHDDMSNVISIATDKQQQLMFLIHSGKNNTKGVEALASFLLNYLDSVDFGLLDKNGMNVWHYVCKLGRTRYLKLLLNLTSEEEWQSLFSVPAGLPGGPVCVHLVAMHDQVSMMKQLKQMANEEEQYKNCIKLDAANENGKTPLDIAISRKHYRMCKVLFDKNANNDKVINDLISIVLTSNDQYDANAETQCLNFKFFQKLLECKTGIDGQKIVDICLKSRRPEYFELSRQKQR